jgi:hypothetical protein
MAFLRVDEIWNLKGATGKKHRCVVSNKVKVAFLSVELHREASGVVISIVFPKYCI